MAEERITDSSDLRLVREMLQAAATETTPVEVKRRALASLGLLALAPAAAVALTASTAAATTAGAAGAGAVGKALWYQAWYVKAALMVGLGSAGAAVETYASKAADQESREPSAMRMATKAVGPTGLAPTARGPLVVPPESFPSSKAPRSLGRGPQSPSAAPAATSRRGSRAPAIRQPVPLLGADAGAQSQRASSIRDEIRLLDKAREELARGRASAAARAIDEYFSRHPQGELRIEAAAVKRESLRQH